MLERTGTLPPGSAGSDLAEPPARVSLAERGDLRHAPADALRWPISIWLLSVIALAATLLSLILDSQTRYHLGDSATFLLTAWPDSLPRSRSWLYGLFATDALGFAGDVSIIPKLQVALKAGAALLLAVAVMRRFGAPLVAGALLVLVILADPLSAWWARSIMADTLATAALCLTLAAAFWPGLPAPLRALAVFVSALLLFFLRNVHAVPVAMAGVFYAVVCWSGGRWVPSLARARREALAVAIPLVAAVGAFAALNAWILDLPRIALSHEPARFVLGAASPLLAGQEELIPLPPERMAILLPFERPLRNAHSFAPNGLAEQLLAEHGAAADGIGLRLARAALAAAPDRALLLWGRNWAEHLDPRKVWASHVQGRYSGAIAGGTPVRLEAVTLERLEALGVWQDPRDDWPSRDSPALRWLRLGGGVSALIIAWAATLALPLILATRLRRVPAAWLTAGLATALMGFLAATGNNYLSRYLIAALPPLLVLAALWMRPQPGCCRQAADAGARRPV